MVRYERLNLSSGLNSVFEAIVGLSSPDKKHPKIQYWFSD